MDRKGRRRRYAREEHPQRTLVMVISRCAVIAGAASVLSAAVVLGSAARAETDWSALSSAGWTVKPTDDAEKLADASAASGEWSAAIRKAFVELGMAEPRAECYGKVLAEQLSPESQKEAAQLVSEAATADDVKTGVLSGGPEMVGGFSAADVSCPESMGG
jgi:hypothetical protein